jgi:4-amino-4-deoxy-L-arabinose transferase-like glycosyltransferase
LQLSTLAKRGTLVLFIAVTAFYLYGLGHLPLLGPDEPRYAQIAREMFLRGDLITPTLGGHIWFEKPALLYWMMILSYKLFGVSESAARLPAAVAGLLTVAAVFLIGRSVEGSLDQNEETSQSPIGTGRNACPTGLGFWCAIAAATTLGILVFSRAASFDIIVTMTMTWALGFFLISEFRENKAGRRRLLAGFYIFIGLSLLAKGLIGIVIPLGIVSVYFLLSRRLPDRSAFLSLFWGIPLSLLVAAIWYGPVIWRHGWPFVDQFFIQHQFARYVSNKYRHPAPVYFYLLILMPLSLPWTAFVIEGIGKLKLWRRRTDGEIDCVERLLLFAVAWILVPLVFFSFSTSKLPGYILPVLPAITLIAGHRLTQISNGWETGKWAIRITAALCILLAVTTPVYAWRSGQPSMRCALIIGALLGVAGIFGWTSSNRSYFFLLLASATLGVALIALTCWAPKRAERENAKHLLQLADQRGYAQTSIFGLQRDDHTPEFYAGGRVAYGPDLEAILYDGVASVIAESQARKEALLVFVPLKDVGYFTASKSAQVDVIGDNGMVAIVAVRAK